MAFQTEFSSTSGYMPVLESAQNEENYAAWLAKADGYSFLTAYVVKVGLDQAESYFTSEAFNGSSVARTQVGVVMSNGISQTSGDEDLNKLFQDAYDKCKALAG